MKYISLFAGIGGFDLALDRLGHECVWVNEWDKYACMVYECNFGRKPDSRDITTIPSADIPDHDLLVGGFPCQAFSVAGKRRGFDDTRGTMFFEIARILRDKRLSYFLLENVKGLLSHDDGKTFQTYLKFSPTWGMSVSGMYLVFLSFARPSGRQTGRAVILKQ